MGGRRRGVGRSEANATETGATGLRCDGTKGSVVAVAGRPVRTNPPAQQRPGTIPCGQQVSAALWPRTCPPQAGGTLFAVTASA